MSNCNVKWSERKASRTWVPGILRRRGCSVCLLSLVALTAPAERALSPVGGLPLFFEPIKGEAEQQVFVARGRNYQFLLAPVDARIVLRKTSTATPFSPLERDQLLSPRPLVTRNLRMAFLGANTQAAVHGVEQMSGKINYLIGNDPAQWRTDIATFARVQVDAIYPGIDLVYYGNEQRLEYDFTIAPRVNPQAIAIYFTGADKIQITDQGELVLTLGADEIRQPRPELYQISHGVRKAVTGGYRLQDARTVQFAVGEYDKNLPLIIDPLLNYATYFGGNAGDLALAVKVDKGSTNGFVYIAGETLSTQFAFPIPAIAFQRTFGGGTISGDAFVAKFGNYATNLVYMTYLGGSGNDGALDLALDTNGNAYVTGFTDSSNFPTANALYPHIAGTADPTLHIYPSDAFVAELNPSGSGLIYSTYLGGSGADVAGGIAVDPAGSAYVTGYTFSTNFPTRNPLLSGNILAGSNDVFITKIGPGGTPLVYSTYLGGTNADEGEGIAVDAAGFAYVTGFTASTNFPILNALQTNINHSTNPVSDFKKKSVPYDAFVAKLMPSGSRLVYSTYLGGTNIDAGFRIAADAAGNAYVAGQAGSGDFPDTQHLPHPVNTTNVDAFLTKISSNGIAMMYSAVFGGSNHDVAWGVAVDPPGNAYVIGITASPNFPAIPNVAGMRTFNSGGLDAFVTAFSTNASLLYSSYLGGSTNDYGYAIDVDFAGNAYLAGRTLSANFPVPGPFTGVGPFQPFLNSTNDAFLAKILMEPTLITTAQGSTVQLMWRVFAFEFRPEFNTNSVSSTNWIPVTQLPLISNGFHNVTLTNFTGPAFFRLRRP
jgi:hypothetical protein